MTKDPRLRALLANVVAYVVVIALMAAVNLWRSPDNLWFIWVALGWGIGVAAHALAFVLRRTHRRERSSATQRPAPSPFTSSPMSR
jgi:hypothetical protein